MIHVVTDEGKPACGTKANLKSEGTEIVTKAWWDTLCRTCDWNTRKDTRIRTLRPKLITRCARCGEETPSEYRKHYHHVIMEEEDG